MKFAEDTKLGELERLRERGPELGGEGACATSCKRRQGPEEVVLWPAAWKEEGGGDWTHKAVVRGSCVGRGGC
ncbi:hypothetical protein Y1Q_0009377 [Alligator mississippiensis]|uniref:Uncharacterized protein n=1 Tax=Alligator mississippiensis TaxID=8496 RepID=A0A151N8D7_ALLMI|nr:hypothetical protein Y1Q_0009377 [Alligator mississippiensis]